MLRTRYTLKEYTFNTPCGASKHWEISDAPPRSRVFASLVAVTKLMHHRGRIVLRVASSFVVTFPSELVRSVEAVMVEDDDDCDLRTRLLRPPAQAEKKLLTFHDRDRCGGETSCQTGR